MAVLFLVLCTFIGVVADADSLMRESICFCKVEVVRGLVASMCEGSQVRGHTWGVVDRRCEDEAIDESSLLQSMWHRCEAAFAHIFVHLRNRSCGG